MSPTRKPCRAEDPRGISAGASGVRSRRGFTLIELLVVTAIMGVALGVVAACFHAGLRVWDAASGAGLRDARMALALDMVSRDLARATVFEPVGFEGERARMRFPALVPIFEIDGTSRLELGAVEYAFDSKDGALTRRAWPYSRQATPPEGVERLETGLADAHFAFEPVGTDDGESTPTWEAAWSSSNNLPGRVRIALRSAASGSAEARTAERTALVRSALWRRAP